MNRRLPSPKRCHLIAFGEENENAMSTMTFDQVQPTKLRAENPLRNGSSVFDFASSKSTTAPWPSLPSIAEAAPLTTTSSSHGNCPSSRSADCAPSYSYSPAGTAFAIFVQRVLRSYEDSNAPFIVSKQSISYKYVHLVDLDFLTHRIVYQDRASHRNNVVAAVIHIQPSSCRVNRSKHVINPFSRIFQLEVSRRHPWTTYHAPCTIESIMPVLRFVIRSI